MTVERSRQEGTLYSFREGAAAGDCVRMGGGGGQEEKLQRREEQV